MKLYVFGALIGLVVCVFTGVPGMPGVVDRTVAWWNKPPEPVVLSALAQKVSDLLDKEEFWKVDNENLYCSIDKDSNLVVEHLRFESPTFRIYGQYRCDGANITEALTRTEIACLRTKAIELANRLKMAKLQQATDKLMEKVRAKK